MSFHGNSKKNEKPNHLYEIYNLGKDNIFKYGISDKPIGKDGLSSRIRSQVSFLNNIEGWLRYVGKILLENIPGKAKATKIETEHIDRYRAAHGRNLVGNRKRRS